MANKEHEVRVLKKVLEMPNYVPVAEAYMKELSESGYDAKVSTGKVNWSGNDETPCISYSFRDVSETRLSAYKEDNAPFDESIEGMITPEVIGYGDGNHFVLTFDFNDEEFPVQKAEKLAEEIMEDLDQYLLEIDKVGDSLELLD